MQGVWIYVSCSSALRESAVRSCGKFVYLNTNTCIFSHRHVYLSFFLLYIVALNPHVSTYSGVTAVTRKVKRDHC